MTRRDLLVLAQVYAGALLVVLARTLMDWLTRQAAADMGVAVAAPAAVLVWIDAEVLPKLLVLPVVWLVLRMLARCCTARGAETAESKPTTPLRAPRGAMEPAGSLQDKVALTRDRARCPATDRADRVCGRTFGGVAWR